MTKKELKPIVDSYKKLVQEVIPEKVEVEFFESDYKYQTEKTVFITFHIKGTKILDITTVYPFDRWEISDCNIVFPNSALKDYMVLLYRDFKRYHIEEKLK